MLPSLASLLVATLLSVPATPQEATVDVLMPPPDGKPVHVEVGLYLVDLAAVDGADQSFRADVLVQLVWKDPRLAARAGDQERVAPADTVWHPRIEVVNRRATDRSLADEVHIMPDGTVSYAQRFLGTFTSRMNLREFPLDRQRFYIQVAVGHAADDEIEVVPTSRANGVAGRSEELSISDWHIGEASLVSMPIVLGQNERVQGIAVVVEGHRELRYYIVQLILPLMMIVTMAYTVFWIDPGVIPTRVGTVVTTMLTLIAYRFALASLVPRLPYLTRLDWFMLGSTSLILATLLAMAASAYLKSQGNDAAVQRIDRVGRVAFAVTAVLIWTLPWLL
ncbi:MAG: hypothetical protein PVJ49_16765 [Acidobacteriota bacterium]|jgi:hypothetical protein